MKYDKLKKQLQTRRDEIHAQHETQEELDTTELSNYDNHPADNATDLADQTTQMALDRHQEEEVEAIDDALKAMEEGTYGTCQVCGEKIPVERLEAVPTALTCVEHAGQSAEEDVRPIEEKILDAAAEREDMDNSFEEVEEFGSSDTPSDK